MTSNVEKVDHAPMPLPASAWRITADLETSIERCLTETGRQILISRFSEDYRNWQLQLMFGQTVDVSVDCDISAGTLKIVVWGDGAEPIQKLLNCYHKIPILKIRMSLTTRHLLGKSPVPMVRKMSPTEQLKFAIRRRIMATRCRITRYKIVHEVSIHNGTTWVICLNTAQQLEIKDFNKHSGAGVIIAGIGTDLGRLQQLMAIFDVSDV